MEEITQQIAQVGIPGAICFYMMTQLKQTIENNTKMLALIAGKLGVMDDAK